MTAVLAPPPQPVRPAPPAPPGPQVLRTAPGRSGPRAALVRYWPTVLAVVAFAVYVGAGCYMLYSVHYEIGDALSRSEDARAVLFSRDPHLAAWGFVWFPGPVVAELPFMLLASPLNHAALAGPLSTAACGAVTVLVLVRLFRRLGLSEPVVAGLTLTYCLNPVIIFYCSNGMSEASFYLAAAVSLLGVIWWYQEGGPLPLILTSMGLAASMAIRYEAIGFVPLMAALTAFRERGWARRAKVAALVALPGAFVFAMWTLANWLIMGSPFFWYQGQSAEGTSPANAWWLPVHRTFINGVIYAARYSWAFVPALVVVLPVLAVIVLFRARLSRGRRFWELATIVVPAAVFPGQVALLIFVGKTWGDPRYFASLTIFASVTLGFAAREAVTTHRLGRTAKRALCTVLVGLGVVNAVSGTRNDLNPKTTPVEGESIAFRPAFGLSRPATTNGNRFTPPIVLWHRFDAYIDPYLAKGQLIMVDTEGAFPAPLFSRYPGQWVIPSDRDFQSLAENFSGQFQWLLQTPALATTSGAEVAEALSSTTDGHWRKAKNFGARVGELYHWVPDQFQ
ncbi:MAG: hypothetical protein ACLP7F_23355 [Acidimicrobiales bacterium]